MAPSSRPTSPRSNRSRNSDSIKKTIPNTRITKRPLLHPPIPSPYTSASSPKVIYISAHTPFISVVKRVRSLLALIEKCEYQATSASVQKPKDCEPKKPSRVKDRDKGKGEEVILKGTGRAVEKVLALGLFFQGQTDRRVRVGTGSVGAVDDLVEKGEEGDGEGEEETRVRRVSVVEVGVCLR